MEGLPPSWSAWQSGQDWALRLVARVAGSGKRRGWPTGTAVSISAAELVKFPEVSRAAAPLPMSGSRPFGADPVPTDAVFEPSVNCNTPLVQKGRCKWMMAEVEAAI